jgi:hypothetical protein
MAIDDPSVGRLLLEQVGLAPGQVDRGSMTAEEASALLKLAMVEESARLMCRTKYNLNASEVASALGCVAALHPKITPRMRRGCRSSVMALTPRVGVWAMFHSPAEEEECVRVDEKLWAAREARWQGRKAFVMSFLEAAKPGGALPDDPLGRALVESSGADGVFRSIVSYLGSEGKRKRRGRGSKTYKWQSGKAAEQI